MIDKNKVKNILFITLSNLGDIILTTPVLESLCDEFPEAAVDVITGAPGAEIFEAHPSVREVTVCGKRRSIGERLREIMDLRRKKYDLVIDLKNSLVPYLVGARSHSRLSLPGGGARHKKDEHLAKLSVLRPRAFGGARFYIPVTDEDREYAGGITGPEKTKNTVMISPGAKSHLKRWSALKYAELADRLISELGCRVLLIGNEDDAVVIRKVSSFMERSAEDLCCRTSLGALFELMRRSSLVITNDSAPLHVASAAGVPTIAIFGPSDDRKYGPLAERSVVLKPEVSCRPCERALCSTGPVEGCISRVEVKEVFRAARKILLSTER
ncbi:MAG: glycosyltransferase family 9 protein [Candidatus Omnitrophota bacterium]|nr:glycosyltransferase family 9 protein [Candidatus Omnitrophota bacterium]